MANVTYVQGFQAQELRDSALNSRRLDDRFKIDRGPIVADGVRLAWSEKIDDERCRRRYRDGPAFAPVTGYYSVYSQTGLEEAANHFLDGSDDRLAASNLIDKISESTSRAGPSRPPSTSRRSASPTRRSEAPASGVPRPSPSTPTRARSW